MNHKRIGIAVVVVAVLFLARSGVCTLLALPTDTPKNNWPILEDPFHEVRSESEFNAAVSYGRCIVFMDAKYGVTAQVVRERLLPKFIDTLLKSPERTDIALVRIPTTNYVSPDDWEWPVVQHSNQREGMLVWYRDGKRVHCENNSFSMTPEKFVRLTEEHLFGD